MQESNNLRREIFLSIAVHSPGDTVLNPQINLGYDRAYLWPNFDSPPPYQRPFRKIEDPAPLHNHYDIQSQRTIYLVF